MAAIQTQFPVGYRRTTGRTVVLPQRQKQAVKSVVIPDLGSAAWVIAALAMVIIVYISGFARMTAVSYQRARIMQQISDLQVKSQIVQTNLSERTLKEAVASWAGTNGMEPANGRAFVLHQGGEAR